MGVTQAIVYAFRSAFGILDLTVVRFILLILSCFVISLSIVLMSVVHTDLFASLDDKL